MYITYNYIRFSNPELATIANFLIIYYAFRIILAGL